MTNNTFLVLVLTGQHCGLCSLCVHALFFFSTVSAEQLNLFNDIKSMSSCSDTFSNRKHKPPNHANQLEANVLWLSCTCHKHDQVSTTSQDPPPEELDFILVHL